MALDNGPDCRDQVCGQRGLQDIAECPSRQGSFNEFGVGVYCQKNYSGMRAEVPKATSSFDSVHHRHRNVEYQYIGGESRSKVNGTQSVFCPANDVELG